jgi:hypothetical protein
VGRFLHGRSTEARLHRIHQGTVHTPSPWSIPRQKDSSLTKSATDISEPLGSLAGTKMDACSHLHVLCSDNSAGSVTQGGGVEYVTVAQCTQYAIIWPEQAAPLAANYCFPA